MEMKNKEKADNKGYNPLLCTPLGSRGMLGGGMCCCLLRLGFLLLFTGIFVSPRLPARPRSRIPAGQCPVPLTHTWI